MRLYAVVRTAVVEAVRVYDSKSRVWLFGSSADDSKRGGYIDIAALEAVLELFKIAQRIQSYCSTYTKERDQRSR